MTPQWRRDHRFGLTVALTVLVAVVLVLLVFSHRFGIAKGTFLAVLGATAVTVLLVSETREYRVLTSQLVEEAKAERRDALRPFVLVDFERPDNEPSNVNSAYLNIRNRGAGPATDIRISFLEKIRDHDKKEIKSNPLIRQGIRYLGPSRAMTLKLADETWFDLYKNAQPWFREGEQPPDSVTTTITVNITYMGISGIDRYEERFTIDVAIHVHGWKLTKE